MKQQKFKVPNTPQGRLFIQLMKQYAESHIRIVAWMLAQRMKVGCLLSDPFKS